MPRRNKLITALLAIASFMAQSGVGYARWGMGGGGDTLRIAFARAKENAAHVTLRLRPEMLPTTIAADVRAWIVENQEKLAADIAGTPHDWEHAPASQATCAFTLFDEPASPILFSYDKCRSGMDLTGGDAHSAIPTFDAVGQMLIHEAVHHLHGADEAFADAVAINIYDAWRRGADDWMVSDDLPEAKMLQGSVAADDKVIVYGGYKSISDTQASNTGYVFDPATKEWSAALPAGGPRRALPILIYTGAKLIVWGGYAAGYGASSPLWQNSGAVLNLANGQWSAIAAPVGGSTVGGSDVHPFDYAYQTAVWTGSEMIVYGGNHSGNNLAGGIFNPEKPASQQWRALSANGAPSGLGAHGHTAVWADDRMIVSGGIPEGAGGTALTNTTASFNPATNSWTTADAINAPPARAQATAVWTGSQMVVFGGYEARTSALGSLSSGGIFDPKTNKWTYTFRSEAVVGRSGHTAVWTGGEVIVFGGHIASTNNLSNTALLNAAAAFNPSTRSWRVVEDLNGPARRQYHSAVWTGAYMLVTGGILEGGTLGTGNATAGGALFYP